MRGMMAAGLVLVLAMSAAQASKLYKWVDKDGHVTYHDRPPSESGYQVEEKSMRSQAGDGETPADLPPVVLYSAPNCPGCDNAREYLKRRQVSFTEKNAASDPKVQAELKKKAGALTVPVLTVGDKIMKGYLESLLEGELDQAGYPKIAEPAAKAEQPEQKDGLAPAP
jgi:glutaredoxin